MIKHLMLNPVLSYIEQEEYDRQFLHTRIMEHEKMLLEYKDDKKQQEYAFAQSLQKLAPQVEVKAVKIVTLPLQSLILTGSKREHLVQEISHCVTEKILYDK
ncbi:MAG: hypothetical protein WA432_04840 [Candidatus Babeliaceae bacterium]